MELFSPQHPFPVCGWYSLSKAGVLAERCVTLPARGEGEVWRRNGCCVLRWFGSVSVLGYPFSHVGDLLSHYQLSSLFTFFISSSLLVLLVLIEELKTKVASLNVIPKLQTKALSRGKRGIGTCMWISH